MNDGPQGFRDDNNPGSTTAFPSGLTMAASWDADLMYQWGAAMGAEFYGKGANVQLGPGLCLARVPRNGRNFEYLSGEDPFLGYTLVQPVVKGIQSQKVIANAKHYVLNNQETNRGAVSENANERTRFEMYYPVFQGAAEAGVGSFMCSYNRINGVWSCENPITLAQNLKVDLGFAGFVMSDWGATHSTSLMAGLDMEMPSADFMNPAAITAGLSAGNITQAGVDNAVFRILRAMFAVRTVQLFITKYPHHPLKVGVMDEPLSAWDWGKLKANVTSEAQAAQARAFSAASTVLLQNSQGLLPLRPHARNRLALLGFASYGAVVHGGGSGSVVPSFIVTPLAGITAAAGPEATIVFDNGTDIARASAVAADADVAIVFVGTLSSEGSDRASLSLDDGCDVDDAGQCLGNNHQQNALVQAVAAAQKNTVVFQFLLHAHRCYNGLPLHNLAPLCRSWCCRCLAPF
jgi:beta-glucosidase